MLHCRDFTVDRGQGKVLGGAHSTGTYVVGSSRDAVDHTARSVGGRLAVREVFAMEHKAEVGGVAGVGGVGGIAESG